jgi:hypothetical protein
MMKRAALVALLCCLAVSPCLGYAKVTDFQGQGGMNQAELTWRTITESENVGFNIHRSLFQSGPYVQVNAQMIAGAGTSSVPHDYTWTDYNFGRGTRFYYKLEDVDASGTSTFHGPIEVDVTESRDPSRGGPDHLCLGTVRPSPASDEVVVECGGTGRAMLYLVAASGRTMGETTVDLRGVTAVRIPLADCSPGVYLVRLEARGSGASRRLVITR